MGLNFGKGGNADTSSSVFNALSSFCLINLERDEKCNNPEFHIILGNFRKGMRSFHENKIIAKCQNHFVVY